MVAVRAMGSIAVAAFALNAVLTALATNPKTYRPWNRYVFAALDEAPGPSDAPV